MYAGFKIQFCLLYIVIIKTSVVHVFEASIRTIVLINFKTAQLKTQLTMNEWFKGHPSRAAS